MSREVLSADEIRKAEDAHWYALGYRPGSELTGHHLTISRALREYADLLDGKMLLVPADSPAIFVSEAEHGLAERPERNAPAGRYVWVGDEQETPE